MKLVQLSAAAAALLLSSTVAMAQETPATGQNFFLDVDGTPVRVTAALAVEACGLDEVGIQQAATSRMESSGIDAAMAESLYASTDMETFGEPAASDDAAAATATADASADMEGVLEGAETTAADTSAAAETPTMTPDEQMLALSVCQIDATRASELGITGIGEEASSN